MLVFFAASLGYQDPYPYMYCQNRTCGIEYESSQLKKIVDHVYGIMKPHISMDFREAGIVTAPRNQGDCNSSWAIATCDAAEVLILRKNDELGDDTFWRQFTNETLDLSEQFVMANDFGYGHFCEYGNPIRAATWISDEARTGDRSKTQPPANTFELEKNFPYNYTKFESDWKNQKQWKPVISEKHYMYPYERFSLTALYNGNNLTWKIPAIKLYNSNTEAYGEETANLLRKVLSLGLPITTKMRTTYNNTVDTVYRANGGGEPIHRDCPVPTPYEPIFVHDHWVTIVGYGKKQGRDCWLVKDTLGTAWGDRGFFFVEVGKNSYCIETSAYTYIPRGFASTYTRAGRGHERFRLNTWDFDPDPECIEDPYPFYVTLGYCLSSCPESAPFADPLVSGVGMRCHERCEGSYPLYVVDWNQAQVHNCTNVCPSPGLSYDDGTGAFRCVSECPDSLPYVSWIRVGDVEEPRPVCQANCTEKDAQFAEFRKVADDSETKEYVCASSCSSGLFTFYEVGVQQYVCEERCPEARSFSLAWEEGDTKSQSQCVPTCPETERYHTAANACTESCPDYASKDHECVSEACEAWVVVRETRQCVEGCPTNTVLEGGECKVSFRKRNTIVTAVIIAAAVLVALFVICTCAMMIRDHRKGLRKEDVRATLIL